MVKTLKEGQTWQRMAGRGKGSRIVIVRVRQDGWVTAKCATLGRLVFVQQQSFLRETKPLYRKIPRPYVRKTCLVSKNVVLNKEGNII